MTKKEALPIVFTAADDYQKNLVNHSLLFICMDKHKRTYSIEVTFDRSNFQHLTGLETDPSAITPSHFFQLCLDRRLKESDFEFAKNGTTEWKLEVLSRVFQKNLSANMIGIYNHSQPILETERIAGNVSVCIGFVRDGGVGRYVPNTVLKGDIRSLVHATDRIIVTYRKMSKDLTYSEIVYATKKNRLDHSQISRPLFLSAITRKYKTSKIIISPGNNAFVDSISFFNELSKKRISHHF